jgi:putative ABC transport system permease protein
MVEPTLRDPRFRAVLLGVLALTGLSLAAVGLFAMASYDAAARHHELGVRVALGASPGSLKRLVVREACLPVVAGAALGLAATWWITTVVQAFLFRVDARNPLYYLLVLGVLVATASLAAWAPARRAARVDPIAALKVP